MKKITLVILVLFTCVLHAQRKPKIKGNRVITEVYEELQPYNAIKLVENLKIKLQKSVSPGYNIIADDNLIDVLKFEVVDSVLTIGAFYKIISKKQLDIVVNYSSLNKIVLNQGTVFMDDMIGGDNLEVNTYGASKIQLNTNAPLVNIKMEGNSFGRYSIDSDSLAIRLNERVNTEIHAVSEEITVEMHNNTSSKIEGSTNFLHVDLIGDSNLKAERLKAATIDAFLQESATTRLNALESFNLSSRDKAKTYLFGNSKISIIEFLDTSELHKRSLKD